MEFMKLFEMNDGEGRPSLGGIMFLISYTVGKRCVSPSDLSGTRYKAI